MRDLGLSGLLKIALVLWVGAVGASVLLVALSRIFYPVSFDLNDNDSHVMLQTVLFHIGVVAAASLLFAGLLVIWSVCAAFAAKRTRLGSIRIDLK